MEVCYAFMNIYSKNTVLNDHPQESNVLLNCGSGSFRQHVCSSE